MRTWLLILFSLTTATVSAQTHRIDSIKRFLSTTNGKKEVDALNALSKEYSFYWIHSDSAIKYANLAQEKASRIPYNAGKAEAFLIKAHVEGRLLGLPVKMEDNARQAIKILGTETNPKVLSGAHYYLGVGLTLQGRYELAEGSFKKANQLAIASKDKLTMGWAQQGLGFRFFKGSNYWKCFPHLIEAQEIGRELHDSALVSLSLALIARTFNIAGDPEKALHYYHQAFQYSIPFIRIWSHREDMAYAHLQLKQYDSAIYYQQLNNYEMRTASTDPKVLRKSAGLSSGYSMDIQLAKKEYDSVILQVLPTVQKLQQSNDVVPLMLSYRILGKAYKGKGDYKQALFYSRQLFQLADKISNRLFLRDASELLSSIYSNLNRSDSAYKYFRQYTTLKDSMETKQYAGRTALYLAASVAENRIRLLKKDKEINEQQLALNRKELQKQSQLQNFLLAGFVVLLLCSGLVVRNTILKRKHEKLRNEHEQSLLKRKTLELEMQALRAQMNPHFIFNCLSAIDNLVQTNQTDKATTYLARFAKLIRGLLDSSKNNIVPFQKDFETLKLYLEMEQFRCNNKFDYQLNADEQLLYGDLKVPALIIQPFVENAIHHGLLNKQNGTRKLMVTAELKDDHIIYSVTDNGIGRKTAASIKFRNKPEQQSYGIQITKERIQLHNKNGIDKDLVITDLEENGSPAGTKAVVRINSFEY